LFAADQKCYQRRKSLPDDRISSTSRIGLMALQLSRSSSLSLTVILSLFWRHSVRLDSSHQVTSSQASRMPSIRVRVDEEKERDMGSKRYRGKRCAYCGRDGASDTGDHVIARGFFLPSERGELPQVPACNQCNNEKSRLEHRLTTVLRSGRGTPRQVAHSTSLCRDASNTMNACIAISLMRGTDSGMVNMPNAAYQTSHCRSTVAS